MVKVADNVNPLIKITDKLLRVKGFTRTEVAYDAGFSPGSVASWFQGRNDPGLSNFKAYLNTFGYDLAIISEKEKLEKVTTTWYISDDNQLMCRRLRHEAS